ncbi:MAG: hypothetical protein IJY27_04915 [Clostridia bacterium]|nr:hypothetical protein [Clostridia bacterium]
MKKLTAILIAALMLTAMFALPTSAADYTIPCDIVISACFSNPATVPYEGPATGKDLCEYVEILNISDHDVDLYDYVFYYVNKATPAAVVEAAEAGTYSKSNVFATAPGENVLKPGEYALIWFISDESYELIDSHRMVTFDSNNKPIYNLEKYWNLIADFSRDMCWQTPPETVNGKIIPWDISTTYGIGASEHFNMANPSASKSVGYFICLRDTTVDAYLTASIVPNTTLSADVEFCFDLNDGKVLTCTNDIPYDITPSFLHSSQTNLANLLGVTFETSAEDTTTATPDTTTAAPEPEVTTDTPTVEDTTPAADPDTDDSTVTTTAAPTTTPTPSTEPASNGGCGGSIATPALMLLCIPAVMLGKKKRK